MAKVTGADKVLRAMQTYEVRYEGATHAVLERGAGRVRTRMKAEHKWQNQTGAAEAGLDCQVFESGTGGLRLVAFHGVSYGKELETMRHGELGILEPTMRSEWPVILGEARQEIKQLGRGESR